MHPDVEKRQAIEKRIVRKLVEDAIAVGYLISVSQGREDFSLRDSRDADAIMAEVMQCDDDALIFTRNGVDVGDVYLVYGNDGHDVICDYSCLLEGVLEGACKLADDIAEGRA